MSVAMMAAPDEPERDPRMHGLEPWASGHKVAFWQWPMVADTERDLANELTFGDGTELEADPAELELAELAELADLERGAA